MRSRVQELADEVNSRKARAAGALGGAVFLILIGAGAAYDSLRHRFDLWGVLGIDGEWLVLVAGILLLTGVALLALGLFKLRPEAVRREAALAQLEREYDELLNSDR
jgi:hypothetical protein